MMDEICMQYQSNGYGRKDFVLQSMFDLQNRNLLCDITIKTKQEVVNIHKLVVASSESIKLQHDILNDGQSRIDCSAYNVEVVNALVRYLYTSDIFISRIFLNEFVDICKHYGLTAVTKQLELFMTKHDDFPTKIEQDVLQLEDKRDNLRTNDIQVGEDVNKGETIETFKTEKDDIQEAESMKIPLNNVLEDSSIDSNLAHCSNFTKKQAYHDAKNRFIMEESKDEEQMNESKAFFENHSDGVNILTSAKNKNQIVLFVNGEKKGCGEMFLIDCSNLQNSKTCDIGADDKVLCSNNMNKSDGKDCRKSPKKRKKITTANQAVKCQKKLKIRLKDQNDNDTNSQDQKLEKKKKAIKSQTFDSEQNVLKFRDEKDSNPEKVCSQHDMQTQKSVPDAKNSIKARKLKKKLIENEIGKGKYKLRTCKKCNLKFFTESSYYNHNKDTHPQKCSVCNWTGAYESLLAEHMYGQHKLLLDPEKYPLKECPREGVCDKKTQVICDICGLKVACKFSLKKHIRHLHTKPEEKHKCHICGKEFSWKDWLQKHIRVNHEERFQCHLCPFTCNGEKLTAANHLYTRHGIPLPPNIKVYQCEDCDYNTVFRLAFVGHKKTHTGEKEHICSECCKGFRTKWQLKSHIKRCHSDEEKRKCELCDYIGTNYRDHYASRHSDVKPFACEICEYKCKLKGNLKSHMKHKHKIDIVTTKTLYDKMMESGKGYAEYRQAHNSMKEI
ncbi:unnamed protein product [Mytilus coruscus]|uniref:KRAB n=1 Tax=Mytilus coruscus TaxID=42192 RepID=A0A6J8A535_MYTCO|nr:unnamed protein product [Mytilus coruscus]